MKNSLRNVYKILSKEKNFLFLGGREGLAMHSNGQGLSLPRVRLKQKEIVSANFFLST